MSERDSPPPLPPKSPRPLSAHTWEQTVADLDDRIDSRKAESLALKADVAGLKADIGRPPNIVTRDMGSGIWGAIGAVLTRVDHVDVTLTRLAADVAAMRDTSAKRGGWLATRGERILDLLLGAALLAICAAVLRKLGLW